MENSEKLHALMKRYVESPPELRRQNLREEFAKIEGPSSNSAPAQKQTSVVPRFLRAGKR